MSYTEVNEKKWPWAAMFQCFALGGIAVILAFTLVVLAAILLSSKAHAYTYDCSNYECMHESTIRKPTAEVRPEPMTAVERWKPQVDDEKVLQTKGRVVRKPDDEGAQLNAPPLTRKSVASLPTKASPSTEPIITVTMESD